MHLSNRQRQMNKTFLVSRANCCAPDTEGHSKNDQDQSNYILENVIQSPTKFDDDKRLCTFTDCEYEIKRERQQPTVLGDQNRQRYFDSPTMITLNDDDDDNDIPVVRGSIQKSIITDSESNLDETELSDLFVYTHPNRILNESMHAVTSCHPSLKDLKYINEISSILVETKIKQEPFYHELARLSHFISISPTNPANDVDENKENRPPLMPIQCQPSRIPIWIPSARHRSRNVSKIASRNKKPIEINKKSCLSDLLNEWSFLMPKLKELLSTTRRIPLRIPELSTNSHEFRRLKQLLNDMEIATSSWTNAINQCRYVLRHVQQQSYRI